MPVKQPRPGDLDPIETASRDEVAALQLERLRWRQQELERRLEFGRNRLGQTEEGGE